MTHRKTIGENSGTGILPVRRRAFSRRQQTGWKPVPLRLTFFAEASTRVLSSLIQLYRLTLSPALVFLFGASSGCRFTPTCSQYAREAIERHGSITGSLLAFKRVCRCHPFGQCGHDPVPEGHGKGLIAHG